MNTNSLGLIFIHMDTLSHLVKGDVSFQQPMYPPLGQLVKQPQFLNTFPNMDLTPSTNLTTMWKTSWGLSCWDTHGNPTTPKITYQDHVKEAFLAKEWNSCQLLMDVTNLSPIGSWFHNNNISK